MNKFDFFNGHDNLLKSWKNLRTTMTTELTDTEHLEKVSAFWSNAPLSVRIIDWDLPESWPDPWSLMYQNKFDESAVSLGMFYTLLLSNDNRWQNDRLQLQLITDLHRSTQLIVLKVDNRWLMNVEYNQVIDSKEFKMNYSVQHNYGYCDSKHYLLNYGYKKNETQTMTSDNR